MLAKCFSFDVTVILSHTLVKLVKSHQCLFVCCLYFFLLLLLLPFAVHKDFHKSEYYAVDYFFIVFSVYLHGQLSDAVALRVNHDVIYIICLS